MRNSKEKYPIESNQNISNTESDSTVVFSVMWFFGPDCFSFLFSLDKCSNFRWLMFAIVLFFLCKFWVERTVRNGYKTTKSQLNASLNEMKSQIRTILEPMEKLPTHEMVRRLIVNKNAVKSITLNRQCERFLYDLLSTLSDQQLHIERCLKNFRSQLNKIHEIVKFRTAIPITSIFVSMNHICPFQRINFNRNNGLDENSNFDNLLSVSTEIHRLSI